MSDRGKVSKMLEGGGKVGNHKIVGVGVRHEDTVWEPLYSVGNTRCGGEGDVEVITAGVLKCRSDMIAGRDGAMLHNILTSLSLGYPQSVTTFANDTITPRRTKSIEMQFYWSRNRVCQQQFVVASLNGTDNFADFFH